MMKRILVPLEGTSGSLTVGRAALSIARKAGARIYFLKLLAPDSALRQPKPEKALQSLMTEATRAGVQAKTIVEFSLRAETIKQHVELRRIDMVVMGAAAFGEEESITRKFIRSATVPVLVIPPKMSSLQVRNIAFASDFRLDRMKPFGIVLDLARLWSATVHLLFVNTPYHFIGTKEAMNNMKRFIHQFRNAPCSLQVYNASDEERGILDFARAFRIDIVAMTTQGRTGFMKILTHSIAESLIDNQQTPMLVMNIGKY